MVIKKIKEKVGKVKGKVIEVKTTVREKTAAAI